MRSYVALFVILILVAALPAATQTPDGSAAVSAAAKAMGAEAGRDMEAA